MKKSKSSGPCWDGYQMVGMKMKGGRKVPNCVPIKKAYTGTAVRQPTETNKEFEMRHEHHTAAKGLSDYYDDII